MEYLKVVFKDKQGQNVDRGVTIDKTPMGNTNEILELEKGTYRVSLMPPQDFKPLEYENVILKNTNEFEPKEVRFEKI